MPARSAIDFRLCFGREVGGHVVRILIRGRRLVEHGEAVRQRVLQRGIDVVGCGRCRVRLEELKKVAGVLREQVDRPVLERGHVGVALTDVEVALDREAGALESLGVDLGDDLVRVVRLRTDDDGRRVAGLRRSCCLRSTDRSDEQPAKASAAIAVALTASARRVRAVDMLEPPVVVRVRRARPRRCANEPRANDGGSRVLAATPRGTTTRWSRAKTPSSTSARAITTIEAPRISGKSRSAMPWMM